jgi:transposase-like protein
MHFLRNALDHLPRKVADDCLIELRWLYDRRNAEEAALTFFQLLPHLLFAELDAHN